MKLIIHSPLSYYHSGQELVAFVQHLVLMSIFYKASFNFYTDKILTKFNCIFYDDNQNVSSTIKYKFNNRYNTTFIFASLDLLQQLGIKLSTYDFKYVLREYFYFYSLKIWSSKYSMIVNFKFSKNVML